MTFFEALIDELRALDAVSSSQLDKLASEVTSEQAAVALKKLRTLEKSKPTGGELARGAAVGAVAGPVAANLSKVIAGGPKAGLTKSLREIAGQAASGAVYGGGLPFVRHRLERAAEMQKLREYAGEHKRGTLRGKIRKATGL